MLAVAIGTAAVALLLLGDNAVKGSTFPDANRTIPQSLTVQSILSTRYRRNVYGAVPEEKVLDYLRLHLEIWKGQRYSRASARRYAKQVEEAKKRKATEQDMQDIFYEEEVVAESNREDIARAHTTYLLKQAERLIVPTPDWREEEMWTESPGRGFHYLSPKGVNTVRAAIRAERKAKVDLFLQWVPAIAGLTGLIGAITGLIAVFHSK